MSDVTAVTSTLTRQKSLDTSVATMAAAAATADQDYAQPPQPSALTPPPPETEERATPQPATNPAVRSWQKKWFNSIRDQLINDYPTASNR